MSSLDSTPPRPGAGPTGTDPQPTQPTTTRPTDAPSGQGWVGSPGAGGPPPGEGGHRPQDDARPPRRRGPGWGGLVVAALVAALVSAGLVGGIAVATRPDPVASAPAGASTTATGQVAAVPLDRAVDWQRLAERVKPSVVTIKVANSQGQGGEGTGVVLDTAGHVLTNNHVATAAGADAAIQVSLSDGRLYRASVVGTDPSTDLAVIQLRKAPDDLVPATFGSSAAVTVGQRVMAVGNPLGLSDTVTTGIISATNRPVTTQGEAPQQGNPFGLPDEQGQGGQPPQRVVTNALQTDAAINPGNSGGPLVDAAGQVIGINSSIASPSRGGGQAGSVGLGFAIPADEAERISSELVADGEATHAQLGVTLAGQDGTATADGTTRQSATVAEVVAGSPAASAGLRAGDQVVAVDGIATPGSDSLVAVVHEHAPGDQVVLTVVRGGQSQEITATLAQSQQ